MNLLLAGSITVLLLIIIIKRLVASKPPLPPGPKGWPIIGNLLDMPRERTWLTYAQWGRIYGGICSVTVFGQPIIVINSDTTASELLDKKGNIYSDRPVVPMGGELIGLKNALPLQRYGDDWRRSRKLFHQAYGTHEVVQKLHSFEEVAVHKLLKKLLMNPGNLASHIGTHIGTMAMKLNYGYDVKGTDDRFVHLLDNGMKRFAIATTPGSFLVDLIPALRYIPSWFPGAGFQHKAKLWACDIAAMVGEPYNYAKAEFDSGVGDACFTAAALTPDANVHDEYIIKWTASTVAAGGFSTRLSALQGFFLMMSVYPEAQRKAQEELDEIVGSDRLPRFADRDQLPYLNALCREVLRFHSVVPSGLPRSVMEDDIHEGFLIPKGSIIIVNLWNMLHDPEVYAKPHSFDPSRFIKLEGKAPERDIYELIFGFGRRVCPGRILVDESLFVVAAISLAVFNISKQIDETGAVIEPEVKQLSGSVSQPTPFQVTLKPRSADALALIMSASD